MKYILLFIILILFVSKYKFVNYNKNIYKWHCDNIYPFNKKLSKHETEYINKCIELSYYELLRPFYYIKYPFLRKLSYFTYSHRVSEKNINSSRIAYGTVILPNTLYIYALSVLRERKINCEIEPCSNINFYGLGWDIEQNHFKIYFIFYNYLQIPEIYKKLLPDMESKCIQGLISLTYINSLLFERKIYTYPKNKNFAILKSNSREEKQYEYDKKISLDKKLNKTGKKLLIFYNKEGYFLDTITYKNLDNYTLYFPLVG